MDEMRPALLTDILDLMLDAVCVVDRQGHFLFVSAGFTRIFGYAADEVIGQPMLNLVYPEDRTLTLRTVDAIIEGEPQPMFENRWVHKEGRVVHVMWSARWSEEHQVRIAVARDITARKQMEARLQHMAGHDVLTDLPNRALLFDRLKAALAQARLDRARLSVLFIDLDDFKQINDVFGHAVGDSLLQEVARRLRDCVRGSDTVGRIGGDEFVVLLQDVATGAGGERVAAKICASLGQPYVVGDTQVRIAPSIGIANYPEHGDDESVLVQRADEAMYRAKSAGGAGYLLAAKGG